MKRLFTAIAFALMLLAMLLEASPATAEEIMWRESTSRAVLWKVLEDVERSGATTENIEKLKKFIRAYSSSPSTEEAALKLAELYVEKKEFGSAANVYKWASSKFSKSENRASTIYWLGYCQYRLGLMEEAQSSLKNVLMVPKAPISIKVKANILLETITSVRASLADSGSDVAIGVVLPIKGPYSKFGEEALRGVLLAADIFNTETSMHSDGGAPKVEVLTIAPSDFKSHDDILEELANDRRVLGVIGPLLSKTASEIAETSQREKLPIIVLSQKEGIPLIGHYVFRDSLTPRKQAEATAEFATEVLGLTRFAILYPSNRYGTELASHFRDEVLDRGGEVVGAKGYVEGQKDFGKELKELFGLEVEERMEGRRLIREYTSTLEVEALYIPDYYESIGQIAPYLAFYNISNEEVRLIGSNGWNSPRLLELGGEHVEGAIFVDGFFAESTRPNTREFTRRFKEVYGYAPGVLEAQAYDATVALLSSIEKSRHSRREVRDNIEGATGFEGATGRFAFDGYGEADNELYLLTVTEGKIREITDFTPLLPKEEENIPQGEGNGLFPDGTKSFRDKNYEILQ